MENLLIFPLNEIIKIDYTLHQQKIKHQLNSAREKQDDFLKSCVSAKKKIDNEKEVEKQMNFYISDMHLGHKKIIQMSKRPFENVEEMQEKMIENWNSTVSENDDVYLIGDIFYKFGGNMETLLKQLHGHKHLIIGNHDIRLLKDKKACAYFDSIDNYKEIEDTIDGKVVHLVLFHYPILEWNGFFQNNIHLYGHIHNNTSNDTYKITKKLKNAYNVGADILGFTPRTLAKVRKMNETFWKSH